MLHKITLRPQELCAFLELCPLGIAVLASEKLWLPMWEPHKFEPSSIPSWKSKEGKVAHIKVCESLQLICKMEAEKEQRLGLVWALETWKPNPTGTPIQQGSSS